jgi:hypothetical protein
MNSQDWLGLHGRLLDKKFSLEGNMPPVVDDNPLLNEGHLMEYFPQETKKEQRHKQLDYTDKLVTTET